MTWRENRKFRCGRCDHISFGRELLTIYVDHPKQDMDKVELMQCPECGECNDFKPICDEPDCTRQVSCGWPTKSGDYRNTCGRHMDQYADQRAK